MSTEDFEEVIGTSHSAAERAFERTKEKQKEKFEKLHEVWGKTVSYVQKVVDKKK